MILLFRSQGSGDTAGGGEGMNDTICMPEAVGEPATRCSAEGERRQCRFTGEFIKGNIPRGNSKFFFISRLGAPPGGTVASS
jgi:hypothetical protein